MIALFVTLTGLYGVRPTVEYARVAARVEDIPRMEDIR
jgi:hypothetical protein